MGRENLRNFAFYHFWSLLAFSAKWCFNQHASSLSLGTCTDSSMTGRRGERFFSPYREEREKNCLTETEGEWCIQIFHIVLCSKPYTQELRMFDHFVGMQKWYLNVYLLFPSLYNTVFFFHSLHLMIKFLDYYSDINKLEESVWNSIKWE